MVEDLCVVRPEQQRALEAFIDEIGMRFSNEFYFVAPSGMLSVDEVPADCGLIEVGIADTPDSRILIRRHNGFFTIDPVSNAFCMVAAPAPWRDTPGPTWQFAAVMIRNWQRAMADRPPAAPKRQKAKQKKVKKAR